MHKQILLFGAGKSATALIGYLINECNRNNWRLLVADSNLSMATSKTGSSSAAEAVGIQVENDQERTQLIKEADIVISLLPPTLHHLVANDCLRYGKNLLTASYLDEKILALRDAVKSKGILFLCEMGLDPGIDHMSAMEIIHRIQNGGGIIHSFKSHCGGLVAPETDDNPWHFKISWNPRNIALAGSAGAVFLKDKEVVHRSYSEVFKDCEEVSVEGIGKLAYYPNRDALGYMQVYQLENAANFMRTTLRHPAFCKAWQQLVVAGLTNDDQPLDTDGLLFRKWSDALLPVEDPEILPLYNFLRLFDDKLVPHESKTSADILRYLLETRLGMQANDRDMVVMLHQIAFELKGEERTLESLLLVKGENSLHTAMAKTVGLPLGIAAKLILQQKVKATGVHIPVLPEIYEPVLAELAKESIIFRETVFPS